mmetsp:Transcript_5136/g.7455  ORF Transcript_5136/g.7455 Transcript_5136/m.7455 type:complete len:453 (-) Transcript_5136:269-1627(-)
MKSYSFPIGKNKIMYHRNEKKINKDNTDRSKQNTDMRNLSFKNVPIDDNYFDPDVHNMAQSAFTHKKKSLNKSITISMLPWLSFFIVMIALVFAQNDISNGINIHRAYQPGRYSRTLSPIEKNEEEGVSPTDHLNLGRENTIDNMEQDKNIDIKSHLEGGTINASKERGKVISSRITAKELYEAYQDLKIEYNGKAFDPNAKWKTVRVSSDDSIQVSTLMHPSDPSCPYVRMRAVVPATVDDVWHFLSLENWEEYMPRMDPFYQGVEMIADYEHRGVHMVLARRHTKRLLALGKRDFTFVSVSDNIGKVGERVSGTMSIVTNSLPRVSGFTRGFQDSIAFYEEWGEDKTEMRLTIVLRIDLNDSGEGGEGGFVPMWLYIKTVGSTGVLSMENLKREIKLIDRGTAKRVSSRSGGPREKDERLSQGKGGNENINKKQSLKSHCQNTIKRIFRR